MLLLAALTALAPFTLQILAPALPAVARDLALTQALAQTLLSSSLVAMAVATLLWGPLSDLYGRRPVMLAALALAVAGSVLAALAPGLGLALAGRLAQAGGAVAGMVLARAVAQDVWGRERAVAVLGQVTAAMVVAPMLAPALSGVIVEQLGWRGVFWAGALLSALCLALAAGRLAETRPPPAGPAPRGMAAALAETAAGFAEVARERGFWAYAGFGVASLATFLFFVGAGPLVMDRAYGLDAQAYGLWFLGIAAAYMAANVACGRVTAALGPDRALRLGAAISLAALVGGLGLGLAGAHHPTAFILPIMVQSVGAGLAVPNALAGATAAVPGRAGVAAGLMGAAQFLFAGAAAQVAGMIGHATAVPALSLMLAFLVVGVALHLALSTSRASGP
ncbi:MAG: MFS transporter, partial [Pseudomonadota bacterium]